MDDLTDRLAEVLRSEEHDHVGLNFRSCGKCLLLTEYDASRPKPDAAERATRRLWPANLSRIEFLSILRYEYAKDNAERDARDKEREEAVGELLHFSSHGTCDASVCDARVSMDRVRRAFGLEGK